MFPTSTIQHWYVLYTLPQFEKKVKQEAQAMKYECYLPIRKLTRKWSDRIKKIEEPLFRNYIFVKSSFQCRVDLLQIHGVSKFVCFDGKPVAIDEKEIQVIKLLENSFSNIQSEPYYTIGEKVQVVNGVLFGMEGTIIRMLRNARLVIKFPLMKQAVSVEISMSDVQKVG